MCVGTDKVRDGRGGGDAVPGPLPGGVIDSPRAPLGLPGRRRETARDGVPSRAVSRRGGRSALPAPMQTQWHWLTATAAQWRGPSLASVECRRAVPARRSPQSSARLQPCSLTHGREYTPAYQCSVSEQSSARLRPCSVPFGSRVRVRSAFPSESRLQAEVAASFGERTDALPRPDRRTSSHAPPAPPAPASAIGHCALRRAVRRAPQCAMASKGVRGKSMTSPGGVRGSAPLRHC